jgi:hypothetical protein
LDVCQISTSHATSVPASWFCKQALIEEINKLGKEGDAIRKTKGYNDLQRYKRIDAASVILAQLPPELSNASDFSKASIEERIDAGYRDAIEQDIGEYTPAAEEVAKLTN